MKFENGKAEEILANFLEEALKEGDIKGTKVNDANLQKLVEARMLAVKFFEGVEDAEFTLGVPSSIHSGTPTEVNCSVIEFERAKDGSSEKAELLQKLIALVDDFSIDPITPCSMTLRFGIDGIWQE